MPWRNSSTQFGSVAKFIHWTVALIIICLLFVGFFMGDLPNAPIKGQVYNLHKLFGLTILSLMILRLLWRWSNPVPVLPNTMHTWERWLEKTVKFCLYAALFAMPITGWIFSTAADHAPHLGSLMLPAPGIGKSKAVAGLFSEMHTILGWTIIVLLCLHIAGALKHHFINKDNILRRMMPSKK
jgi:cytochrome b561